MLIDFSTCERDRALGFIKKVYPSKEITDTPDSAGPLLDFVERDIVRIQDPMMYGSRIGVVGGTNHDDKYNADIIAACKFFAE